MLPFGYIQHKQRWQRRRQTREGGGVAEEGVLQEEEEEEEEEEGTKKNGFEEPLVLKNQTNINHIRVSNMENIR